MSNFITVSPNGKRKGFLDIKVNVNFIKGYQDYYIMISDYWIHINETVSDIDKQIFMSQNGLGNKDMKNDI